ncbi:hypothetical protein O3Q52_08120 [Streptomyces sp. ActVer]|uniref:hypothetical protein n=1 Tax=Streptomyces sp. ActVer TaxID=3014558 RepID=UPI0022B4C7E9|nr:hypothetical protein [Streptomyces sp. ActVer]MCZ4508168.1 hypothetical protein [Streptomyces sp. ActVer]
MEHGGISRPFGWIHSIEILKDIWLAEPTTVRFSRCNLFLGGTGIGKTHFISLLSGLSSPSIIMDRRGRSDSTVHAAINWYNPQPRRAEFRAEGKQLLFSADGTTVPFLSQPYRIVTLPSDLAYAPRDVRKLGRLFGLDHWIVRNLITELPEIVRGAVKQIRIVEDQIQAEYTLGNKVISDRGHDRSLDRSVGLEVLVALAETYARTQPTLLLIDELYGGGNSEFEHNATELLSSPIRGFQTVATSVFSPPVAPEWTVTRLVYASDDARGRKHWARLVQDDFEG